jgi:hypothetical protein
MSIKDKFKSAAFKVRTWVIAALLAVAAWFGHEATTAEPAYAVTLTLPSQYVDGSALPLPALTSYSVAYRVGAGAYTVKVVNGPFTTANQSTTIPKALGQTCANAFVTAGGMASAATSPDVCVANTGPPRAPTGLALE